MYTKDMIDDVNQAGLKLAQRLDEEYPELAEKWILSGGNQDVFYRSLSQDEYHQWQTLSDEAADEVPGISKASFWGLLNTVYVGLKKSYCEQWREIVVALRR